MKVADRWTKVRKGQRFVHALDMKVYEVHNPKSMERPCHGCFFFVNGKIIDECLEAPKCDPDFGVGYVFKAVFRNGKHLTKEDVK